MDTPVTAAKIAFAPTAADAAQQRLRDLEGVLADVGDADQQSHQHE
jgi:hypothetical protein